MKVVEMVRLTIRLPKSLRDDLERVAEKTDRSPSAEARRALRTHIALHDSRDAA